MPKLIDYPRKSFESALEVAGAIDYLGGKSTIDMCAAKLGKAVSGSFKATIQAAIKHGLITSNKGYYAIDPAYGDYKHAYTEDEKRERLSKYFLLPPMYEKIYQVYSGKSLPVDMLSKLMIREYGVEEASADRIAGYFISGLKLCGLINESNVILGDVSVNSDISDNFDEDKTASKIMRTEPVKESIPFTSKGMPITTDFIISISGPGINTNLSLKDADDFIILSAIIKKLQRVVESENNKPAEAG